MSEEVLKKALEILSNDGTQALLTRSANDSSTKRRIDYFVGQLGFPRVIVESTLDSLGPAASYNDILNRLNRLCLMTVGNNKLTGVYRPPATIDKSVGVNQESPPLRQQQRVVDPTKLRPIVIDGSNVAMR